MNAQTTAPAPPRTPPKSPTTTAPAPFAIVTSGQTGVAIAGLCVARTYNIATGGTAAKGWRTEHGRILELEGYGLIQHQNDNYGEIETINAKAADAILMFRQVKDSAPLKALESSLSEHQIPCLVNPDLDPIAKCLFAERPTRIHIAGNSETECPGIGWRIYLHLGKALRQAGLSPDKRMARRDNNPLLNKIPRPPSE